jgi:hypothetical protein
VATTEATDQNAPVAQAVAKRADSRTGKLEPSATTTCPAANTARAAISVTRAGIRRVSSAMVGEPTIIPTAKTVISSPAWATLTCRSPAISGSRPATTNSVVSMRNVPAASTYTTNGSRTAAPPAPAGTAGDVAAPAGRVSWSDVTAGSRRR